MFWSSKEQKESIKSQKEINIDELKIVFSN